MSFRIPNSYRDPKIFALASRICAKEDWSHKNVAKLAKDPEFREFYYNLKSEQELYDLGEFCTKYGYQIIVNEENNYIYYGKGLRIMLRIQNKSSIWFKTENFFYHPKGLGPQSKTFLAIISTLAEKTFSCSKEALANISLANSDLNETDFLDLETIFRVRITIWSKTRLGSTFTYKILRFGTYLYTDEIELHLGPDDKLYPIIDKRVYFSNYFVCKNRKKGCRYVFNAESYLKKHEKLCSDEPSYAVKQIEYGYETNAADKLIKSGYIDMIPRNDNFVFYDIESLCQKSDQTFGKSRVLNTQKLVSIAANKFINGEHVQKCWVVKDGSSEAETEIVGHFLEFLRNAEKEMKICDSVRYALKTLNKLKSVKLNRLKIFRQDEVYAMIRVLESCAELPIFGFNNQSYDNNIIFNHLVKNLDNLSDKDCKDKFSPVSIKILKKGTKYFSIKFENLHFKDLLNFTSPQSLDKYLQTWTENHEKLIYPYEYFQDITEIRQCTVFPSIEKFSTVLKGEIDKKSYDKCKFLFDYHRNLPVDHKDYWKSFENYLIYYNISDVYPTSLGMIKQFRTFEENFGKSPIQSLGLPSFAAETMYDSYDKNCANIFSFSKNSNATQIFRDQIIGGLVNVMKRHVTLLDESAPDPAKFNKKGTHYYFVINLNYFQNFNDQLSYGLPGPPGPSGPPGPLSPPSPKSSFILIFSQNYNFKVYDLIK